MITSKASELLVSIIINCHNGEKYLRNAIDSVFSQTYGSWEIIFWDNWSSDNSAEIARSYGSVVKYFRSESFTSLYAARNYAIAKACGDYIAFLDCDDVWLCNKLEVQVAEVLKGSKIVYGAFETFSGPAPASMQKLDKQAQVAELLILCYEEIIFRSEAFLSAKKYLKNRNLTLVITCWATMNFGSACP